MRRNPSASRRPARPAALATLVIAAAIAAAGCGRQAVRAAEKAFLADQVMLFDDDRHEASAKNHVRTNREGAAGGRGAGGGGCGCN